MKQVLISAIVAAVVSVISVQLVRPGLDEEPPLDADQVDQLAEQLASHSTMIDKFSPPALSYTDELIQDGWVNAARAAGAEHKPLAPASNSICYLTKIEIKGIQGPQDSNSCSIAVDEFTGYWQVTAAVDEGGQSEVRCNARCLVWK